MVDPVADAAGAAPVTQARPGARTVVAGTGSHAAASGASRAPRQPAAKRSAAATAAGSRPAAEARIDGAARRDPTYRVVALGLEASGKTVLLASMAHRLSETPPNRVSSPDLCDELPEPFYRRGELAPDRSYVLRTDFRQDAWLSDVYKSVSDPSELFPPATPVDMAREFLFDCMAPDKSGTVHTVFRVSYVDYAGALLESEEYLQRPTISPTGSPKLTPCS